MKKNVQKEPTDLDGPHVRYNKHRTKLIIIFSPEYRENNRIVEGLTRAPADRVKRKEIERKRESER